MFLLAVIHQTTTPLRFDQPAPAVFLLAVIHQTTTAQKNVLHRWLVFLLAVIHQTTTRKCKGLKDNEITSAEFSKKWKCKYLIAAKLLKKFQLYRLRDFLFLDGAPNIDNVAVLSICNG